MVQGDIRPKRRLVGYAAELPAPIAVTIGLLPLSVGTARDYIGAGVAPDQRGQPYSRLGLIAGFTYVGAVVYLRFRG